MLRLNARNPCFVHSFSKSSLREGNLNGGGDRKFQNAVDVISNPGVLSDEFVQYFIFFSVANQVVQTGENDTVFLL